MIICRTLATYKGRSLLSAPRTDPDEPNSSIRLLPRVFDGEALVGPGVKDARLGVVNSAEERAPSIRGRMARKGALHHLFSQIV